MSRKIVLAQHRASAHDPHKLELHIYGEYGEAHRSGSAPKGMLMTASLPRKI